MDENKDNDLQENEGKNSKLKTMAQYAVDQFRLKKQVRTTKSSLRPEFEFQFVAPTYFTTAFIYRTSCYRIRFARWIKSEQSTKYMVSVWFAIMILCSVLLFNICEHLEKEEVIMPTEHNDTNKVQVDEARNFIVVSLILIIFVGYGLLGFIGGTLLLVRVCMHDPAKRANVTG